MITNMNIIKIITHNIKLIKAIELEAITGGICSCTCSGYGNRLTATKNIGNRGNITKCNDACKTLKYYFSACDTIVHASVSAPLYKPPTNENIV